jgi:phosphoribosylformimino-5-aminoimidazole carboxamide ribotide isomerase
VNLYPAIDLRDGRVVRLTQGDFDAEVRYETDPVATAQAFAAAGAEWIHVVDLDAARTGLPSNRPVIERMAGACDAKLQVGGGVRSAATALALRAVGVERAVVGTMAVEDVELTLSLAEHIRLAIGLDVRGREVATHGWTAGTGRDLLDVLAAYEGDAIDAVIVTQIDRDGTLEGPDLDTLRTVLEATEIPVIASGGVGELGHLRLLAGVEVAHRTLAGVIVGKALHEGRFTAAAAVAALRP